jgi:hypothetical protein
MAFLGGFTRFPVGQGTKLSMALFVLVIIPTSDSKLMHSSHSLFVFAISAIGGVHLFWKFPYSATYVALEVKSFSYPFYLMTIVYHERTYL